jgi:hypothetical protein
MIPLAFLEDPRLIDKFAALRSDLPHCDLSTIAGALGMTAREAVYAVSFNKAWDRLGLDKDSECSGPHTTYH